LKPETYSQVLQFRIPVHQEIELPPGVVFLRVARA
jgi:hypothetical protein